LAGGHWLLRRRLLQRRRRQRRLRVNDLEGCIVGESERPRRIERSAIRRGRVIEADDAVERAEVDRARKY
jgi:hypothetical protein